MSRHFIESKFFTYLNFTWKPLFSALPCRLVLSWLIAVTGEYLLLPAKYRRLEDVSGLAQMSPVRVSVFTLLLSALFSLLFTKYCDAKRERRERLGIAASYAALAAVSLRSSYAPTFFAACGLIFFPVLFYYIMKHSPAITPSQLSISQTCLKSDRLRPL